MNPLSVTYKTSDSRFITLTMLQPGRYFADFCTVVGLPELVTDERFLTAESIFANGAQAKAIIAAYFKTKTYAEWLALLPGIQGQWAAVQNFWELSQDVQLRANGLVAKVIDSDGIERELIASPVTFDNVSPELTRAPQFAEHTDEVLLEYGYTMEQILELKIAGALT
jgi:crotonobetainyl-CoA:carnitine CoA-transferase CaiB-like acyl-CoA transferase